MIGFWLGVIAVCCVIFAALLLWLAVIGARTVLDWRRRWWRDAHAVIEETQEELSGEPVPYWPAWLDDAALLRLLREAGCGDFDEYAETALRVTREPDWDEALERLVRQEGTER